MFYFCEGWKDIKICDILIGSYDIGVLANHSFLIVVYYDMVVIMLVIILNSVWHVQPWNDL
jgi:hypothetical protein